MERNLENARRYGRFVYEQDSIPFAPHLLYPQFLNDHVQEERNAGICMGLEMLGLCDELWAFGEQITTGMAIELAAARSMGKTVRHFDGDCREVLRDDA
jgi:hypothetical protein